MAIMRWNPWKELDDNVRTFDQFFNTFYPTRRQEEVDLNAWSPRVDIYEDKEGYTLTADLPGLSQEEVKVNVENNILSIHGERKLEKEETKEGYTRLERTYGAFHRSFTLPNTVDLEKINAKMEKGVLKIELPRKEETKPKQIEVAIS